MLKKSFILISIIGIVFSQPPPVFNAEFVVGGMGGQLTTFDLLGKSKVVGTEKEFANTSWIAPAGEGLLISNFYEDIVSYIDFRGANKLHTLKNLTHPVMIGENSKGDWYVACVGYKNESGHGIHSGSGIAIGVSQQNYTVYEHAVPYNFDRQEQSPWGDKQEWSRLEAVNHHAFNDDHVIALDTGWDYIYHWGLAEWKEGLQIIYKFERGFGPRSLAFHSTKDGHNFMFVLGEYDPSFVLLEWND